MIIYSIGIYLYAGLLAVASLFNRKAAAAKVRGNVCLEKMPDDLTSVPGFDPLPPESAIGPGADPFLARARASDGR